MLPSNAFLFLFEVLLSSQALQHGLGMDNPDPFAEVIQQEAVIKENGAAILLNDLVTIAIQEGGHRPLLVLCLLVSWPVVVSFNKPV